MFCYCYIQVMKEDDIDNGQTSSGLWPQAVAADSAFSLTRAFPRLAIPGLTFEE